jgi:hypothetical protein
MGTNFRPSELGDRPQIDPLTLRGPDWAPLLVQLKRGRVPAEGRSG